MSDRGAVICDVDGTLAERDQPVNSSVAAALAEVADAGWRVMILTGQPLNNISQRLLPVLRVAFRHLPSCLHALRVLTCEGAGAWHIGLDNCVPVRMPGEATINIPEEDRNLVTRLLRTELVSVCPGSVRVLEPPIWHEGAMCVFKLDTQGEARRLVAAQLLELFRQHGLDSLRVGLGGTFSIVITHRLVHKGNALAGIVESLGLGEWAFYLADEFMGDGNDTHALRVRDLVCLDFSRPGSGLTGHGPPAAAQWLRHLANLSNARETPTEEIAGRLYKKQSESQINLPCVK